MSMFAIRASHDDDLAGVVTHAVEAARSAARDAWAAEQAAMALSQVVAERLDASLDLVWDSLCHVPDNLLGLLETPEGWAVLSSHVAATLGHDYEQYLPVVH